MASTVRRILVALGLMAPPAKMLTFLQLSDIHFRHGGSTGSQSQDYAQRESLIEDARRVGEEIGGYSAVLVAGDIANTGNREQFSQAGAWLRNLCTAIGVKPWMVWTVPGNHDLDVDRIEALGIELRERVRSGEQDALDALLDSMVADENEWPALLAPLENYIEFADSFECAFQRERLHWMSDLEFSDAFPLQLRGLSSTLFCAKGDVIEETPTMIGQRQATEWHEGAVHFSMCHHPHAWLLDREELEEIFGKHVQVRVTGHLHCRSLQHTDVGFYLRAGAITPERRDDGTYREGFEPTYDVISLRQVDVGDKPFLDVAVHPRVWDDNAGDWSAGDEEIRRFAIGPAAGSEELSERPDGKASELERPDRQLRYALAQLPLADKYECLERIGAPLSQFLDVEEYRLVTSIFRWAEDNDRIEQLRDTVNERNLVE